MGHKKNFDEREGPNENFTHSHGNATCPFENSPILQVGFVVDISEDSTNGINRNEIGLVSPTGKRLEEKKLKTGDEGQTGAFIKSERFPKSLLSPHLKLKELAQRKVSTSPGMIYINK